MGWTKNNESETHVVFSRLTFSDAGSTPAASTKFHEDSSYRPQSRRARFLGRSAIDSRLRHAGQDDGGTVSNLREAIEGCLSVLVEAPAKQADDQVIELAL